MEYIYADNAATTKLDLDAFEAMKPYLLEEYGNASQPYAFSRSAKKALREARITVAECIGALPEEIYFTSGGTESDNWAIKGALINDGGNIVTSQIEHHAVLRACAALERFGHQVIYIPVDSAGIVHPKLLQQLITDNTQLISVMMANNEIGTIEPIAELAKVAHNYGSMFHTDAVQAVGHIPVDVKVLDVDMLSASAHKFNGPKGIGFLYIKKGTDIRSYIDGGAQEFGMRAGTENVAFIVAMAVALKKNCVQMQRTEARILQIEQTFLSALTELGVPFIRNGAGNRIPGNISISIRNANGEMLLHRLDLKGICISTGSACDSKHTQISHVIKAIAVPEEYAEGTVRISFGRDNNIDEALKIAKMIKEILKISSNYN